MELSTSVLVFKHMVPVLRGVREWSLVPLRNTLTNSWLMCCCLCVVSVFAKISFIFLFFIPFLSFFLFSFFLCASIYVHGSGTKGCKWMELSNSARLSKHMVSVPRGVREWSLVPLRLYLSTWFMMYKRMELSTSAPLSKHIVLVLRGVRVLCLVPLRLYLSTWFRY
jgi:hypothetical protein